MIYGYCRVSSKCQLENNSFEQQEQEILSKYSNANISREQFTGTTTHRPVLDHLLNQLQQGDTLVVTKLDRLARTTIEGLDTIENLICRGISIHILNMGYIDNTPASELIRTIFLAFAKYERDMIVERTQAGKAVAKTKVGFKEGRPKKYTPTQINHALDLLKEYSYTQVENMTGISKATLTREMRKRKSLSI